MKNFALMVAFALLPLAVPASAAEISKAAPATTLEQITGQAPPLEMMRPPLTPYCSAVQGTSCTTVGATTPCTDVCSNQLSCTCGYNYSNPNVKFWNCDWEC
jgi:hypothetical protein